MSWLRLLRSRRVGISTFYRLLGEHGSAEAALAALPGVARDAGLDDYAPCPPEAAQDELAAAARIGARMLCRGEPGYPQALCDLADAPPILWVMGDAAILHRPMIALVGARNASSLGLRMTRRLARELGDAGHVVVSGLARGVDTAAHEAALDSGTVAVLGGGVDRVYPAENGELARRIVEQGARLSEAPMGVTAQARHFPARNRIISALSSAVVIVEAAARSGSLITARCALDQGREVCAVPGHPFDARAAGCNMLIRDGARLVRNADDVIEALTALCEPVAAKSGARPEVPAAPNAAPAAVPPPRQPANRRALRDAAALHRQILDRLGPAPLAEDQLIRDLRQPAGRVAPALVDLELDGRISRQPGGLLSRRN